MEIPLEGDNVCYVCKDSTSDTSTSSTDDINDVIECPHYDVHPVMLVTHVNCHHNEQHTDISLETVIDKSSDLEIAKIATRNHISEKNLSCNSQEDLLLKMSSDELDISVCSPSMTSSPKILKVLLFG